MACKSLPVMAAIVWMSGATGVGVALDQQWGRMGDKDTKCDVLCDMALKPLLIFTWPTWMPGYLTYKVIKN